MLSNNPLNYLQQQNPTRIAIQTEKMIKENCTYSLLFFTYVSNFYRCL